MNPRHITLFAAAALGLTGAALIASFPAPAAAQNQPVTAEPDAEAIFFRALNEDASLRDQAIDALRTHIAKAPDDGRAALLLGVGHLWYAAENPPERAQATQHLILATHYLRRAAALSPEDDRIPSWLYSAELSLAEAEGRASDAGAAMAQLRRIAEADPCFHSVAFAIAAWDGPPDRAEFREAIAFLERASRCGEADPSVQNLPRWPYNVQGFLIALADCYLKAGDVQRAEASLVIAESRAGFDSWPHRNQVEHRFASLNDRAKLYADDDPSNDPPFILARGGPVSCLVCHQSAAP